MTNKKQAGIPHVSSYKCTLCHKEFPYDAEMLTCPDCGEKGILDILYDYDVIKENVSRESLAQDHTNSMWRYKAFLPLQERDYTPFLRVGWTPLYESLRLGDELGLKKLYIKDDGLNPTASLKDRASAVAVAKALELGYDTISCSSTGNAASSCAGNAARMGLKSVIFVPERAPEGKLAQMLIFGARVVSVIGDYKDTFDLSKMAIEKYGWFNRNAGINPVMAEGKKTVSFEIAEQLNWEPTDWVVLSVGDGCTVGGVYLGFRDLYETGLIDRIPKILGVQSCGCSPFFDAGTECRALIPTAENTCADSISVGVPRNPVKAQRAVAASGGEWVAVPDEEILAAMSLLGRTEGIFGEPAGVTGTAGIKAAMEQGIIKPNETVTVIVTGNGLKDTKNALAAAGSSVKSKPTLEALQASGILD
ncbi:MAG: threonine synthase [Saccharofermentanales bacterium]|jgi:threonine synthase|nr:threonine synthase [Eubacteriales bacterium]MDD3611629.1 threonine synthase [Eubacteriales bacterium]HHU03695.1 threonine synthase [Fastidiosipila sp.]